MFSLASLFRVFYLCWMHFLRPLGVFWRHVGEPLSSFGVLVSLFCVPLACLGLSVGFLCYFFVVFGISRIDFGALLSQSRDYFGLFVPCFTIAWRIYVAMFSWFERVRAEFQTRAPVPMLREVLLEVR